MSQTTVRIPTPLRSYTGGADEVLVEGTTVSQVLEELGRRHEGLRSRILDDRGQLRQFVNVFVGGMDIRALGGLAATVADGDVLAIIPAVAGGAR